MTHRIIAAERTISDLFEYWMTRWQYSNPLTKQDLTSTVMLANKVTGFQKWLEVMAAATFHAKHAAQRASQKEADKW